MPIWSDTHKPGDYVIAFHHAVCAGPGAYVIWQGTEREVKREGKRFNAFKAALRRYPQHPSAQASQGKDFRLSYEQDEFDPNLWFLWCNVRWSSGLAQAILTQVFDGRLPPATQNIVSPLDTLGQAH